MPAKLKYLLKKNLSVVYRNWRWTVTEPFIVAIIFVVIVVNPTERSKNFRLNINAANNTQFYKNGSDLYDLSVFQKLMKINPKQMRYSIIYTPITKYTREIARSVRRHLGLHGSIGAKDEDMLINYFIPSNILCGIVFHDFENDKLPTKMDLTLRFHSSFHTVINDVVDETLWITRCSGVLTPLDTDQFHHTDLYLREGFLQIQHRIFMEWLRLLKFDLNHKHEEKAVKPVPTKPPTDVDDDDEDDEHPDDVMEDQESFQKRTLVRRHASDAELYDFIPKISVYSMRHLTDHEPCYTSGTSNLIWFLYYFTFFLPFLRLIKRFAREQEENIHAHQWIYGYECGHHRVAHFIISFFRLLILDLLIVLIVSINWTSDPKAHIFRNINIGILIVFLLLYTATLIIYAMIVAKLFADSTNCMLFGAALWLGSYGLFGTVLDFSKKFTASVIFSLIFFFNNCFPLGMRLMKNFQERPDYRPISYLLYTQIGSICLLAFILSLVDCVRPGRYIRKRSFNYLGIPYMCRSIRAKYSRKHRKTTYTIDRPGPSWNHYEYGPMNGSELLFLKNIVTYLKNIQTKQQLRNVTMRFFRGEISVLLGSHSSGKTRLISYLAGWRKPAAGYIYYDGDVDIYDNWIIYRNFVDVSMPNNPLFDLLSVRQTLEYFCKVKIYEFNKLDVKIEVEKWLKVIKPLISDGSILIKDLTFSHKRIVSLCCTLLCDRPIILLDEPTLHMTATEQRFYWQILQQEKANRAIIVATFSVDEADAIGDRIGILNDGFLVAYGSSFFLRSRFGYGFDLIIMKDPKKSTKPINEILKKYIVDIRPENHIGDQVIYKLPGDKKHMFQRMLIELEKESQRLGITNIRMSGSDLSEIYVTLGTDTMLKQKFAQATTRLKFTNESKVYLKQQQIRAMLYKKMIHQAPNLIPIIMIFVVFLLIFLINEMTKSIPEGVSVNSGLELGFRRNETTRALLKNYTQCKFVEVNEIEPVNYVSKTVSKNRYYIFKKLFCGKDSYEDKTRKDSGIYDKLGAVQTGKDGKNMTIWINERIFHTAALALNLAHNLILENLYPNKSDIIATIRNKPMVVPLHTKINILDNQISHLRVPLTMGTVMPITMSCFIISLVEERYNHLYTLQRIAGIRMHIYWIVGILWDFGTFITFSFIYILTMALTTIEGFGTIAKLLTFVLINVHGFAALTMVYLLSLFMGGSKSRAFLIALVIQFMFGLGAYIFYWDVLENNKFFFYLLSLSPTFSLLDAISNLYTETKEQEYCAHRCQSFTGCNQENICGLVPSCCFDTFFKFEPPGIMTSLTFMMGSTIIFILIFILVSVYRKETKYSLVPKIKEMGTVCYPSDDPDVVKEKSFIASLSMSACKKYNVLVDQLEEKIPKHSKRLNTVSFALKKQISMGVYGSRHCGKSHLLHQLVGDHGFRFGEVYICEKDCKRDGKESYKYVGFCPQDRGVCDAFTPRQLFTLLFMIRGVPPLMVNEKLAEISRSLYLRKSMCKKISSLPVHVKRKVNIAIALIVYNRVFILDEPTRGMPPLECRIIWNVLRYARYCGNTIIFSSSDSLECETMSDYMIVVDKGEMLAIGSPHYLKQKYTKGFYLEAKLYADGSTAKEAEDNLFKDVENLIRYANFLHEDSVLINRSDYTLKLYIPVEKITYSYLFGSLERNRNRLNIAEYTIQQVSLLTALENIHATRLLRVPYKAKKTSSFVVNEEKPQPPDDNAPAEGQLSPQETVRQKLNDLEDDERNSEEAAKERRMSFNDANYRSGHRSMLYHYGDDDDDDELDDDEGEALNIENLNQQQNEQPRIVSKTKFQLQAEIHSPPEEDSDENLAQGAQSQPPGTGNKSQKDKKETE